MPLKTIKIFIASSSELKSDREDFRTLISLENDRLSEQGIYLKMLQWENFLDAISDTRLQDEYNRALRECDIAPTGEKLYEDWEDDEWNKLSLY
jgi:hypothetical protein